ncbi:nucleotidyl transferase AbiEii/AbiGii toxin family protein, partial [Escherichia coli]|nr:nucleotidyl transferase AbiEii/AbiGii toxin family protein [Escherichia coli]
KTYDFDFLSLDGDDDNDSVKTYSLTDLMAEKYRSVLQQKVRERNREQDIYDINYLLGKYEFSRQDKYKILESLLKKSEGKQLDNLLNVKGIRDVEIIERSSQRYQDLSSTVKSLPLFEDAYEKVACFYESLPWDIF